MRSAELFGGCGGLALGLARAGFKHELIVECDRDCIETLKENKRKRIAHVKDWLIVECSSHELNFENYKNIDLVSGGPPCQPFSIGGKHLGPKDPRNMWPEAIRAVREIQPKAFVFENVRGLLRPDFSGYLDYIVLQLAYPHLERRRGEIWKSHLTRLRQHEQSKRATQANYRVLVQGINTADYGAAQKRHRVIVIGVASQFGDEWKFPAATHSHESLVWSKHIEEDYWRRHGSRKISLPSSPHEKRMIEQICSEEKRPKENPWVTVRDAFVGLPSPRREPSIQGHWQHHGARAYRNHTGSSLDEPAKALKAGDHGVPGGENMLVNSRGSVRYFTIREMARLQGFPDNFLISGSWKAATRQLGNAVPVCVGEEIGRHIMKTIRAQ
ncbi:MAG TPA: DNA cytosine methyltransferase [Candidatus Angelobacter sp.]|jgi:DNA (cytosine-5)-methyltransferase 1|nr:DNA cytosine methyltransferase [Candidatus Angelobacter sp.]